MRKSILGAASALAFASPAAAADLTVPRYSEVPSYEYHTAIVEDPTTVIVAPPPMVIEEYPIYAAPPVYAAPPAYAYAGPVWHERWSHRGHFRGRW